jgi:hypothetical protein
MDIDIARVDVIPDAPIEVVEPEEFVPRNYLVHVLRADGGSCVCGIWHFYSATCGHLHTSHGGKCGRKRTGKGTRSAFCSKTSTRILISNVQVNENCPSAGCQQAA